MKTIQASEIRKMTKALWPEIGFQWLTDKKFSVPKLEQLKAFLSISELDKQEFIDHAQDCDDFALQLHAEAKRYFVQKEELKYPLAFGECFATRWAGFKKKHNANICVCEDGIYLIEPQTDEIRKANSKTDNILIVRM